MSGRNGRREVLAKHRHEIIVLVFALAVLGGFFIAITPQSRPQTPAPTVSIATTTVPDAFAHVPLVGKAAIVVDLSNGQTLYEYNADAQLPLASLTKLLTTYAALESLSPSSTVAITPTAIAQDGDYGLSTGEQFQFESIARFALVASSNDAAEAIAEAASNARAMNTQDLLASAASSANLSETYAINGTGLDESTSTSGGYGSARDVARLASEVLERAPDIAHATTLPSVTAYSLAGVEHTLPNTDIAVDQFPDMLLSKTGYTDLAGGNLAIIFDVGINHPIAVVVLGSTENSRFTDVGALVEATLAHFAGIASAEFGFNS